MIAAPPATARAPKAVLLARIRDDVRARGRALLVARLMIAVYLLELLLNLTRPHVMPGEPAGPQLRSPGASWPVRSTYSV